MDHPYKNLPAYCYWSTGVTQQGPGMIDPVTKIAPIGPDDKIATMGSCFAQHISRHISAAGLCYFVPEEAPHGTAPDERNRRGFGMFSARYGNIYTPRQALQLFQRAFGEFVPQDDVWKSGERYVDAFRPRIEPDGYDAPEAVQAARKDHLANVRRVFLESDWLVLTLGLTECWRARQDGAVFPVAPGVSGGEFDPNRHEFVNFSVADVISDLTALVERVREKNPSVKFLLTVSPVPLNATYENRHVLSSTVCSKAILRAAADEMERKYSNVIYFPAFEIVTSPAAEGRYFHDDLREVTPLGVGHVMRLFKAHFIDHSPLKDETTFAASSGPVFDREVVCDENEIAHAMQRSEKGFEGHMKAQTPY
jgi:hypothetical protein